jgi:hypothetical protein
MEANKVNPSEDKRAEEIDKLVEQRLLKMMEDDPTTLITYFVIQMGKEAVKVNADYLNLETESTIEGQRYKIKCRITTKKVKK